MIPITAEYTKLPTVLANIQEGEPGGVVVEHQTPNLEVLDSIPTGSTLCP